MKRLSLGIFVSVLTSQLTAMQADVLPKVAQAASEEAEMEGRFQRYKYLYEHRLDGDPSKEELFQRLIAIEVVEILDYDRRKSELYNAVLEGDIKKVQALLAQSNGKELVNQATESGWTPLHVAAGLDFKEIMQALLAAGALVNPQGDGGFSPLHWAAGLKHDGEAVKILLNAKVAVNAIREEDGITALHLAQTVGTINALLDGKAEIEARDKKGWTPLYTAVYYRRAEAFKALCERGANLDAADNDGKVVIGAGPLFPGMTPEFRKLIFDYWQPHFKKQQAAHMKKMFGFK